MCPGVPPTSMVKLTLQKCLHNPVCWGGGLRAPRQELEASTGEGQVPAAVGGGPLDTDPPRVLLSSARFTAQLAARAAAGRPGPHTLGRPPLPPRTPLALLSEDTGVRPSVRETPYPFPGKKQFSSA